MPTGSRTLRSRRMPATVVSGFSSSCQTRSSAGTASVSLTEGASKCGVTMAMSPSRGMTIAVRRSLRHHDTPVKYTMAPPGSSSNAPMPLCAISLRALSMRSRYSSRPMGLTSAVMGASAASGAAASVRRETRASRARAPPRDSAWRRVIKRRLVLLVGLLFDDSRARQGIDALLDGGAFVVGEIHGARQLDEPVAEALGALLVADLVLDHPEFLVHVREVGLLVADVDGGRTRILPGLLEQPEFMFDVGHL